MFSLRILRRSAAALLVASVILAGQVEAAPIPDAFAADSTAIANTSNSALGINSDSHLTMVLLPLLAAYVMNENFRIILDAINTRTTSGGPYPIQGVYFEILLSYHLIFLNCIGNGITCTAEPDQESGGTRVTGTIGGMDAGQTKTLEVEVKPAEAGTATITGTLHQNDYDPNEANNTVSLTFDISEPQNGAVNGYKFEDLNGNGQWESDEPGLNDWTIRLLTESGEATTLTADMPEHGNGVTTPLETGWFEFLDVVPGSYQVHENVPDGWVQSAPDEVYYEIVVNPLETVGPLEFGNYRPGSIMGSVYDDKDTSGSFGGGDAGLSGRTVTLNGTDGKGNAVSRNTTTSSNGSYAFTGLAPGTYTVTSTAPAELPQPIEMPAEIALTSGMTVEAANFGFGAAPAPRLEVTIDPNIVQSVVGALIPFTVTATNTGTATATDVRVGVGWLAGLAVDEFTGLPSNCEDDGAFLFVAVMCPVGNLAPSASTSLTFHLRLSAAVGPEHGLIQQGVDGGAEAANHQFVSTGATLTVEDLGINLGGFRARPGGNRKTAEGEVDVYLDSVLVISALEEGAAASFAEVNLTDTRPMLHVLPTGETDLSQALFEKELAFGEGKGDAYTLPTSYFLVINGNDAIVVRDAQVSSPGAETVSFSVVHAAPGLGTVDLSNAELGTAPIQPGKVTGYGEVSASMQQLNVLAPGTQDVLGSFRLDWTNEGGKAFVLVLGDGPVLESISADGAVTSPVDATGTEAEEIPDRITLYANYPNPFNPVTTLSYAMPTSGEVLLEVFDALGRRVAILAEGVQSAGRHEVTFNAEGLPSGLYVYRLTAGETVETRTMVALK